MVAREAFSVQEFCEAHSVSRAMFYRLVKQGNAPALMKCGKRTLISKEAAAEWRQSLEENQRQRAALSA